MCWQEWWTPPPTHQALGSCPHSRRRVSSVGKDMREVDWAKFLNIIFWNVNYWDQANP